MAKEATTSKRRTKPYPPSRIIKMVTACNPSISNVEKIVAGLTEWLNTVKEREIAEIDNQIAALEEKKAKIKGEKPATDGDNQS